MVVGFLTDRECVFPNGERKEERKFVDIRYQNFQLLFLETLISRSLNEYSIFCCLEKYTDRNQFVQLPLFFIVFTAITELIS